MAVELKTDSRWPPAARSDGDFVVAVVRGDRPQCTARSCAGAVLPRAAQPPRRLVLNLAKSPTWTSSAIAVLVEALQKIRKTGGKI